MIKINLGWKHWIAMLVLALLPIVLMFGVVDAAGPTIMDQCKTGSPPTGSCSWINGILNPGANTYFEGMATPQRLGFTGLSGVTHTLTFDMQWTKAGLHAYDWPVSWAQAQTLAQSIGHYSLSIFPTRCNDLNPGDTTNCNLATITQTANVPTDPYISGQFGLPATDGTTSGKESAFSAVYGTPQIQISSDQPFTFSVRTPTHSVANAADTGDSQVTYSIAVTGTGVTSPTVLLLMFAAHIAISDAPGDPSAPGTTWGQGFGAKNISGAPYHVSNGCFDGSCSSQDNQLDLKGTPLTPSMVTHISSSSRNLGQPVSDTVTMTLSSSTIMSGQVLFYVCGPTGSASPCLPQYTTKTLVTTRNVSVTTTSVVTSSTSYTPPNQTGNYCFLVQWINQDSNSQSFESFTTTNECAAYGATTAVTVSSINALRTELGKFILTWVTASEVKTAGFNIYRSESRQGPFTRVNSNLIPASSDTVAGAKYQYEDTTAQLGKTYYYQLEDVELNGGSTRHDPISMSLPETLAANTDLILFGTMLVAFVFIGGGLLVALKKLNVLR